jgi:hypothetical protein
MREKVTPHDLARLIQDEFDNCSKLFGCELVGTPSKLPEPYPDGGNWDRSIAIRLKRRDDIDWDPQRCGEIAAEAVERVGKNYNLL